MGLFSPAVKETAKLRMAISGPSGSGKTYTSLVLARSLVGDGGRIALVDTEHGSASKYADLFTFDTAIMSPPYAPEKFSRAILEGSKEYDVVIIDSISHAWNGTGGILQIVEETAKAMKTSNKFAAWRDATPRHESMIESMLSAECHIIVTMRSKTEYALDRDDRGQTTVIKRGLAPIQRDGFEYEFDVLLDMNPDNSGVITKTRCPALTNRVFDPPSAELGKILSTWLSGPSPDPVDEPPKPKPAVKPKPSAEPTSQNAARTQKRGPDGAKPTNGTQDTFPTQTASQTAQNRSGDSPDSSERTERPDDPPIQAGDGPPDVDGWVNSWVDFPNYTDARAWGMKRLSVGKPGGMARPHFENGWQKCFTKDNGIGATHPAVFLPVWRKWVNGHVVDMDDAAQNEPPSDAGTLFDSDEIPF